MKRMRGSRSLGMWWGVYGLGAVVVLAALFFTSRVVLDLERREAEARHESLRAQELRLALWKMDSMMLPLLAQEAARTVAEYSAYSLDPDAGIIWQPSPLLSAQSEFIRLHFEVGRDGVFRSPQVPQGGFEQAAILGCLNIENLPPRRLELDAIRGLVAVDEIFSRVRQVESRETTLLGQSVAAHPLPSVSMNDPILEQNQLEYSNRLRTTSQARQWAQLEASNALRNGAPEQGSSPASSLSVGILVPLWLGPEGEELFCFRRVVRDQVETLQGLRFDWPRLREALLSQVSRPLELARLLPVQEGELELESGMALTTIPARLVAGLEDPPVAGSWSPARVSLGVAWAALAGGLVAAGISLRSSIAYGARRSRFAAAVTHELRTPLTTFRMYSEMLADGLIPVEKRASYLETLKEESARLAMLVENVLSYARVEDGRQPFRKQRLPSRALVERVLPLLERRCAEARMPLEVDAGSLSGDVETDVDGVGQVLMNLVDNACKYAASGPQPKIEWQVREVDGRLRLRVTDHGPGIDRRRSERIFAPFERADHTGDAIPGVGLGLALAREIARDLGGELALAPGTSGACFEMHLPLVGPG